MPQSPDPRPEPVPAGISLDELTEAFAQVMGTEPTAKLRAEGEPGELEREPAVSGQPVDRLEDGAPEQEREATNDHDPCEICPRTILEAMLFVGNRENQPLAAVRAAGLMRGVEPDEIAGLVDELNGRYAAEGCPYQVVSDGAGYRLALRKAFHPLRNRFYGRIREARLSQAAVDVLAIVAYQQPLTGEQVSRMRGKPSSQVLSQLVRRGLLRIERRQTKPRTATYFTTDRFLNLFGLEALEDLPQSGDLDRQ